MADDSVSAAAQPAVNCTSPNRALWKSLSSLQHENSQLKVQIKTLERSSGDRALTSAGSSKFLRMELEREKAEAGALRQQLEAAEAQCASSDAELAALRRQLEDVQAELRLREEELAARDVQLLAAEAALQERDAALAAASGRLAEAAAQHEREQAGWAGEREAGLQELARLGAELEEARSVAATAQQALAVAQAGVHSTWEQLQAREAELGGLRDRHAIVEAGFLSQVARLEAAVAELQQRLACAAPQAEAPAAEPEPEQGCPCGGPAASGANSPAASLGVGFDCAGGAALCCTPGVQIPSGVPESAVVYNVIGVGSPAAEPSGSQQEERLTGQVLSLQDKLGTLQAAHEALLIDYSTVTEQLAARQAEVQLARLSPESSQLKQQVLQLQDQVLALQAELFASRSFSCLSHLPAIEDGGGSGSGAAKRESKLKRSFTRAASNIGRGLGLVRRQKSSASLGVLSPDSRATSISESVASHSQSVSPYLSPLAPGVLSPHDSGHRRAEAEALLLRQQLQDKEAAAAQLEARLAAEAAQHAQLQAALIQQGEDLAEARDMLARKQAELEIASKAAQQLMEVHSVPTEAFLPGADSEHVQCRETVDMLFKQMWKERMARQKAEFALESASRRSTTVGELDEEALARLQAEAAAADTLSAELQRAKGHQLQLQQRLEALQLQLAKQNSLLESARTSSPSPRAARRSAASPCKEAIAQHQALRLAEGRAHEAESRLAALEQEVAQLRRRERGLNMTLAQAAESRKTTEQRQQQRQELWRRRLAQERWEREKMTGQLHSTAVAQRELLSGLEVLQALLRKKAEGAEGSQRGRHPAASTPRSSTDTQEALRRISGLLRTAHTHLQILSPQHSDCAGQGDLGSPAAADEHLALSLTARGGGSVEGGSAAGPAPAWRGGRQAVAAAERLSDPVEPASPRLAMLRSLSSELEQQREGQPEEDGAEAGPQAGSARIEGLDDVLRTILAGGAEADRRAAAAPVGEGSQQQQQLGASFDTSVSGLLHLTSSGQAESAGRARNTHSTTSQGSGTIPAAFVPPYQQSRQGEQLAESASSLQPPGVCSSWRSLPTSLSLQDPAATPRAGQASSRSAAKGQALGGAAGASATKSTAGSGSPRSPRMRALAEKISSGFKKMGLGKGCSETKTRSGGSTPASKAPPPGSARSADGGKAPAPRGQSPLKLAGKPRKIWV